MSGVEIYQPQSQVDVKLTEAAKKRLLAVIQATDGAIAMRLSVKKRGCSGYAYELSPIEKIAQQDYQMTIEGHYILAIDVQSYEFFQGLVIDYVKQGLQTRFVFQNPKQTGQCGCGESFTIN